MGINLESSYREQMKAVDQTVKELEKKWSDNADVVTIVLTNVFKAFFTSFYEDDIDLMLSGFIEKYKGKPLIIKVLTEIKEKQTYK